jgi:hypothetical protein
MLDAKALLDRQYHEMRWRILSLAADLDRLQRAAGGDAVLRNDRRIANLQKCIDELRSPDPDRAERVQMILNDRTPDPRKEDAR